MSFKWSTELVVELDDRRHGLREPVGLMVVAAGTHLLDQDDETIRELIGRAEQRAIRFPDIAQGWLRGLNVAVRRRALRSTVGLRRRGTPARTETTNPRAAE